MATLEELDDGKKFDQFHGKRSTYQEEIYTTRLNTEKISKEDIQKAEIIEKQIKNLSSEGNVHLAEERGQQDQRDLYEENKHGEEMLYSGVYRDRDSQRYH